MDKRGKARVEMKKLHAELTEDSRDTNKNGNPDEVNEKNAVVS